MQTKVKENSSKKTLMNSLRFHSIFTRTLKVQLCLVLGVIILFYFWANTTYRITYKNEQIQNSYSLLHAYTQQLETRFMVLETRCRDFFLASKCSSLAITGVTTQDENILDVTLELSQFNEKNSLAKESWLYVAQSNSILTSRKAIWNKDEFEFAHIIDECLAKAKNGQSALIWLENKLYWFQGYPNGKNLMLMCVEVNIPYLYDGFKGLEKENESFFSYYQGVPLFPNKLTYPNETALLVSQPEINQDDLKLFPIAGKKDYLMTFNSEIEGITTIMFINQGNLLPSFLSVWTTIIPFCLAVLLLLILASLTLVKMIYQPMQRVIATLQGNVLDENETAKTEIEYIEDFHKASEEKQQSLRSMLIQVRPAVTERLLGSILDGKDITSESIQDTLNQVESSLSVQCQYQVIILKRIYKSDDIVREGEKEIHRQYILSLIAPYWQELGQAIPLPQKDYFFAFILKLSEDAASAKAKRAVEEFREYLKAETKNYPYDIAVGVGRFYHNLIQLKEAYEDAALNLQTITYYRKDFLPVEENIAKYSQRITNILNSTKEIGEKQDSLEIIIAQVIEEASVAPQVFIIVVNAILEKLIYHNISPKENWIEMKEKIERDKSAVKQQDIRISLIMEFCKETQQALEEAAGKEQFRHVENAKRFIENNYTDSSLSLDTVSRACGLSSSYLSRLFMVYLPLGFLEYLNRYRIDQAKLLMASTNYTISDIGFKTGFNSSQSFIRVFKKYENETPGQYRIRMGREEKDEI